MAAESTPGNRRHGKMAAKSSIRDTARVLNLPLADADRIAKLVPNIKLDEILPFIGIEGELPLIGYVFRESFLKENIKTLQSFIKTSNEAREILKKSDKEWIRIAEITGVKNNSMLEKIRDSYRKGVPSKNHQLMEDNIKNAYKILSKIGGKALVGDTKKLSPGTYWKEIQ